ncbi:MAG TPA: aldo/keto reductase [Terracidiphilus sp.]|jgi:aryl-alcohol dehydrogenase-like predicted oxidoreductase|nr:aldo/keto reductase [Terracidiphilus sp.]
MKTQQLGRTNLVTSQVGLGAVELGLDYGIKSGGGHRKPGESEAIHLLHEALDLGISFIDTARMYGTSEEVIGKALSGRRTAFTLATKVAPLPAKTTSSNAISEHIDQSVAASLRTLRTDHIDLLMLHSLRAAQLPYLESLAAAMRVWQRAGYVRCIGASVYADAAQQALQSGFFDCLQIAHNALDREAEQSILPIAGEMGTGIVIRSVMLKGVLTERYRSLPDAMSPLRDAVGALDELARAAGIALPELALRYALHTEAVVLTGTAHSHELRETVRCASQGPLDPALMTAIRQVSISNRALLNPDQWTWTEIA